MALLLDDVETARPAATELAEIAGANARPALRATADAAAAAVALPTERSRRPSRRPQRARSLFDEIDLSYESARAAVLLGRIHQAQGNDDEARVELTSP